jgi:hypothetical protein
VWEWLTGQREALGALWSGLSPQAQDSIVTAAFTIVVATAAALLVVRQIGRQAARVVEGKRQVEAMRLKRDVYNDLQAAIGSCEGARLKLRSYIEDFLINVDLYRKDKSAKWVPSARPPDLLQLFNTSNQTAGGLVGLLGRLRIVEPRMEVFSTAFAAALHDVRHVFQAYLGPAVRSMAVQAKEGGTAAWNAPGDREFERLERVSADLLRALDTFGGYLADLETETQNTLLGELFKRHLLPRTPGSDGDVVVRLDRYKELVAHFEKNSPWGVDRAISVATERPRQPDAA